MMCDWCAHWTVTRAGVRPYCPDCDWNPRFYNSRRIVMWGKQ